MYALEPTSDIKKVIRHLCEINFSMLRWLAHSGVQLESEMRQRLIANDILGENLEAEVAPFCFSRPSCDNEIRAAAYHKPHTESDQPCR